MDRGRLKNSIARSPFFWTGILLLASLAAFSYHKGRQVEKEAEKKIRMMARNLSVNNIAAFNQLLNYYTEKLEYLVHTTFMAEYELRRAIDYFAQTDSLMRHIEVVDRFPCDSLPLIQPLLDNSPRLLLITVPAANGKALALSIHLNDLHDKVAKDNRFSDAYLTVSHNNQYVFHPDESRIGARVEAQNQFTSTHNQGQEQLVVQAHSDYLRIPVYRYFSTTEKGGAQWIFTANVPRISFGEMATNIRMAFIYTSLLATIAFGIIFLFGMMRRQKELLKRQHIQQEKIALELKNEQQKQQVLATELEQLKSGLNPHFLFNSLSSLKVLVNKQPEEARNFAVALSNLYRYLLKQEKRNLIPFVEELRFTKDYVYLQQIRFAGCIHIEITINEKALNRQLPPMSLQLLVENCIKHTKMSPQQPLNISVYTRGCDYVTVKNNYNPIENALPSGIGLRNLTKRYAFLTPSPCFFGIEENCFVAKIPLL